MNKQQLATKIWEQANAMRSKIEANEYKDYILGFIFYKYLSDQELKFLRENDFTEENIKNLTEEDTETVQYIQGGVGYFIAYKDLFSTWITMGKDFDIGNVRDALSAFSRLISKSHKKVFDDIFDTLQTGLSKLGDSAASQTKSVSELLQLIKDIPMDGKQDYDVLGFVYEYLISMFAANAGKKAGEFYTPHEISLLMSEIVAEHLKERKEIKIYDPTSGSGSLLLNIGKAVANHINNSDHIKYYAQELKQNTYNLTRMNLVMQGIIPDNIVTRNGDTLEDDWPFFEENDPLNTYEPLYVDAVVSNPPYSQRWDSTNKATDPRYAHFGLAPKTKADYAFLLHDLYHLRPDGIMTIVLPHGVLFRGGEEGIIRKKLIEHNHIDTIIGLPANIFFGTGIPTIIIVLKQQRTDTDVLIVDASKGFTKEGKNNKLRASDIKKITDAVFARKTIKNFATLVSKDTIKNNDYNLNIPRYVESFDESETWDLYASMFGGIPLAEINEREEYWTAFPNLKNAIFTKSDIPYVNIAVSDIKTAIRNHPDVNNFMDKFTDAFSSLGAYLKNELIEKMSSVIIAKQEALLSQNIFERISAVPLLDKYQAYQLLDDEWVKIATDLEIIQTESFAASKKVDPNMVIKKKDGKDHEVQDGWLGHVLPFELVQQTLLPQEVAELRKKENRLSEILSTYEEIIDSLTEEEKDVLNETNNLFVADDVTNKLKEIYYNIETVEIKALNDYIFLINSGANKNEKKRYELSHREVIWTNMKANKDGTFGKNEISKYISFLKSTFSFPEESFEHKIVKVDKLLKEEKSLKKQVQEERLALHLLTKTTIENLSDEQVLTLLEMKWIHPLVASINQMPLVVLEDLLKKIQTLVDKYATTYEAVAQEIKQTEDELCSLISELDGDEFDMKGLSELQKLLKGE